MEWYETYQAAMMSVCLWALALLLPLYGVVKAWPLLRDAWNDAMKGRSLLTKVFALLFLSVNFYLGAAKPSGPSVRWDDGLRDNGTVITNDTVAVRWTYSGIPGASSVFIDYREAGTTNDWLNLAETLASAQEWTGTLANATNYDYWVYSTYVPPVPVHTNGVWVVQTYETKSRVGAKSFLILNGKIQEHGRTIAPPSTKRKEVE